MANCCDRQMQLQPLLPYTVPTSKLLCFFGLCYQEATDDGGVSATDAALDDGTMLPQDSLQPKPKRYSMNLSRSHHQILIVSKNDPLPKKETSTYDRARTSGGKHTSKDGSRKSSSSDALNWVHYPVIPRNSAQHALEHQVSSRRCMSSNLHSLFIGLLFSPLQLLSRLHTLIPTAKNSFYIYRL